MQCCGPARHGFGQDNDHRVTKALSPLNSRPAAGVCITGGRAVWPKERTCHLCLCAATTGSNNQSSPSRGASTAWGTGEMAGLAARRCLIATLPAGRMPACTTVARPSLAKKASGPAFRKCRAKFSNSCGPSTSLRLASVLRSGGRRQDWWKKMQSTTLPYPAVQRPTVVHIIYIKGSPDLLTGRGVLPGWQSLVPHIVCSTA